MTGRQEDVAGNEGTLQKRQIRVLAECCQYRIEVYTDESEGVRTLGRVSLYLAAGLTAIFVSYVFAKTRRS